MFKFNTKWPRFRFGLMMGLIMLLSLQGFCQNPLPDQGWWMANGNVQAIEKDDANGIAYLGGAFTALYPKIAYGAVINTATAAADFSTARPNGPVYAVIPDGAGGWYIGGTFTEVGGIARNNLARINASGQVTSWNPDANGGSLNKVAVLVKKGSVIYVGGSFTSVGGQARNSIAAVNATTGLATAWNPDAGGGFFGDIAAIAVSGSTIYVAGGFTTIGGQPRNYIAALNASTGLATSWNPNADAGVLAIGISGNTVYAGGLYTSIGGQPRSKIAALDAATGLATAWDPVSTGGLGDGGVYALAIDGNTVYAGGGFTNIGGQPRAQLAALDATTGLATSWDPAAGGSVVYGLSLNSGILYVCGLLNTIGGQPRSNIGAIDIATAAATSWNPGATSAVNAIAISGNVVYAGGNFIGAAGLTRNRIAAIDLATGMPTSWNPNADGQVSSIAVSNNTVYAGGGFMNVGGQPRTYIAALDAVTGQATSWDAGADGTVSVLRVSGNTVYAAGSFTSIGGQTRNRIAALDAGTSLATSWDPNAGGSVAALILNGNTVYAAGAFNTIGGQTRNRIAALDAGTGLATSWDPNANGTVSELALNGNTLYAAGSFTSIGGQTRNRIAALNVSSGLATSWNPNASAAVTELALSGNTVFAGGTFTSIGGQSRSRLAALDATTGLATSWNPNANNSVLCLNANNNSVLAGGSFLTVGGIACQRLAAFKSCTGVPSKPDVIVQSGGAATVCPGQTRTFTVPAVTDAGYYKWIVPTGATIVSGQGTTSIQVSFDNAFGASGTVQVRSQNDCGTSLYRSKNVSKGSEPHSPGAITQSGGAVKVCPGETRTFSISPMTDVTSYLWEVPTGASIVSGQGTVSVVVSFMNTYASVDTIKVAAVNGCGTSIYKVKAVNRGTGPSVPSVITGDKTGVCSRTGVPYSVVDVAGLSYTWSFDNANGTIAAGQGSSAVTADFAPAYLAGSLQVTASDGCGISPVRKLTINAKPGTPASITGATTVCTGTSGVYSTASVANASTYTWQAPAGSTISDGIVTSAGTSLTTASSSVTVHFGSGSGNVRVKANNDCGSSGNATLPVIVNGCGRSSGDARTEAEVNIYPNPARDQVHIHFYSASGGNYSIRVYDIQGKELIVKQLIAASGYNEAELNTSAFASGMYHLVIGGPDVDYRAKLILDK